MSKALSFQPRTETELEQFRILTNLLKLLIDRRARQLERVSSLSQEKSARVKNELDRLRRYSASLEEVMRRVEQEASSQQLQQRDNAAANAGNDDQSVSRTVVNGINQPLWLLEQLRKMEQQRRRSRSEVVGQVD